MIWLENEGVKMKQLREVRGKQSIFQSKGGSNWLFSNEMLNSVFESLLLSEN
jgi:hypothetical protein